MDTDNENNKFPAGWVINLMGISFIVLFVLLGLLIYALWPCFKEIDNKEVYIEKTSIWCWEFSLSLEQRTIILVLITGAIGSFIHAVGSFASFVGEGTMEKSWIWWYLLRPFEGMAVAFIFYLVFRGGLLTSTPAESLNLYGVLTLSGLAGLFSDRATLKLREIFDTLFQPKDERSGKLKGNNGEGTEDTDEEKS
ncbi:hypothetical protein IFO69_12065 [Echinicola sp. CAU 1574]|uniref:Uncharacterized protein n=1 Tax=Echinicola arenosa TaxID=2774144 RepID=A0ABR9AL05_9BACT|nr:hypothetical protein [Echinicola arenosa]MBD8489481.1 hypothetical protein [Echinicola arenosa]